MSTEAVAAFLAKVDDNPELAARLRTQAAKRGAEAVAELAAAAGYRFTASELEGLLGRFAAPEGELDDAALAHVVGGINPQREPPRPQNLFAQLARVRRWLSS